MRTPSQFFLETFLRKNKTKENFLRISFQFIRNLQFIWLKSIQRKIFFRQKPTKEKLKMKTFATIQSAFIAIGLCASPDDRKLFRLFVRALSGISVFTVLTLATLSCLVFISKNATVNMEDTLYAVFPAAAASGTMCAMFSTVLKRQHLREIFNKVQSAYIQCKNNS